MEIKPKINAKADKMCQLFQCFTLKTANSACSMAFYAQISGIRANPLKYTDPDGKTFKWLARLMISVGIKIFGGPVTKAIYNDSLKGTLKHINATNINNRYGLSEALKNEVKNINIGDNSLIQTISNGLLNGDTSGSNNGKVSGKGSSGYGSDMSLIIGGFENLSWNITGSDKDGNININIIVTDTFNFEKRNDRSKIGEFLTSLGRDAKLKEADITVQFNLFFKKNEKGTYEPIE
jgi:hypothetical protein